MDSKLRIGVDHGYVTQTVPKNLEELWGPVPLHHLTAKDLADHPYVRIAKQR